MNLPRKTRSDAILRNLPAAQKEQLKEWMTSGVPTTAGPSTAYKVVRAAVGDTFGLRVPFSTLAAFYQKEVAAPAAAKVRAGAAIRALRIVRDLPLSAAAKAAGVTAKKLRAAESGNECLSPAIITALEGALGVAPGTVALAVFGD